MTPTPKSKLTLKEILNKFAHDVYDPNAEEDSFKEATNAILSMFRELVPEAEMPVTIDGKKRYNPDFQRGFNSCRSQMLKNLEAL